MSFGEGRGAAKEKDGRSDEGGCSVECGRSGGPGRSGEAALDASKAGSDLPCSGSDSDSEEQIELDDDADADADRHGESLLAKARRQTFVGDVVLTQDLVGGGAGSTGTMLWDSCHRLLAELAALPDSALRGRRVLELGAGCGLLSIAAARRGARVLATDGDAFALSNLRRNLVLNAALLAGAGGTSGGASGSASGGASGGGGSNDSSCCDDAGDTREPGQEVQLQLLAWGDDAHVAVLHAAHPDFKEPDWVLASDLLYDVDAHAPLLRALLSLVRSPRTLVLLSYRVRNAAREEAFLDAACAAGFRVESRERAAGIETLRLRRAAPTPSARGEGA
jgi:predicted nicotinamide N-methyase